MIRVDLSALTTVLVLSGCGPKGLPVRGETTVPRSLSVTAVDSIPDPPPLSVLLEGPTFTPFTVAPTIRNVAEVLASREREYPKHFRDAGVAGMARVYFLLDEDGRVLRRVLDQSSGYVDLDAAALRVSETHRFSPALRGDRTVHVWVSLPIRFGT